MQVYPCPICGRESNRRGKPFDDPTATEAHITGSHNGDHAGVRGEEKRDDIGPVERDEADREPSVGPDIAGVRAQVESLEDEIDRLEHENNHGMGQILEDVDELHDRLDEHERMIGELVEWVQILTLAVDKTELKNAEAVQENEPVVPIDWREPADEFVSAQYR